MWAAQSLMSSLFLYQGRERPVVEALARWVADEFRDKRNSEVDTSSWPRCYETDIPQQTNGSDCGVFTLQVGGNYGLSTFVLRLLIPMGSRGSSLQQWATPLAVKSDVPVGICMPDGAVAAE